MTNEPKDKVEDATKLKTFRPLGDRVLVLQHESKETKTTIIGYVEPDSVKKDKEKPLIGFVVALGTKVTEESIELNDVVYFGRYAGNDIQFNETMYLSLDTGDLLGVLK